MKFIYESYLDMLKKLKERNYKFVNYHNWENFNKTVILRHDVDNSLKKAAIFSEYEKSLQIQGVYFVLVSTNFYNIFSRESRGYMETIINNGGTIGLHFDEIQYDIQSEDELKEYVYREIKILSELLATEIDIVSMHRPSEKFLSGNIEFDGIINTYSQTYFKDMKYLSDSRRHWRENVDEIIEQATYQRLHILTHPFWYEKCAEMDLRQSLKESILNAALDYYDNLNDNFRDLSQVIEKAEIKEILGNEIRTDRLRQDIAESHCGCKK